MCVIRHEKWDKARLGRVLGRITRKIDNEAREMKMQEAAEMQITAHREHIALRRAGDHGAERGLAVGHEGGRMQKKGVGMEELAVAGGSDGKVVPALSLSASISPCLPLSLSLSISWCVRLSPCLTLLKHKR